MDRPVPHRRLGAQATARHRCCTEREEFHRRPVVVLTSQAARLEENTLLAGNFPCQGAPPAVRAPGAAPLDSTSAQY